MRSPSQHTRVPMKVAFLLMFGLSLLDNTRGPFIPVVADAMRLTIGEAGQIMVWGQVASALAAVLLIFTIGRWGLRANTLAITILATLSMLVPWFVHTSSQLLFFGAIAGFIISFGGTLTNIFGSEVVPEEQRARVLAGLHGMYGVASLSAPLLVSHILRADLPWPAFFLAPLPIFAASAWLSFRGIHDTAPPSPVTLPRDRTVRRKLVFLLALFSIYVGGEVLTSSWMTAWLVGVYGMTVPDAAPYMVAFFTLLACARLLCFAFLRPSWEIPILIGVLTMSIAFQITAHQGLPLAIAGCGILGPFFPILLARVSRQFPNEWRAFLLGLMLAIPTAMTLFQALVARAADVWGMSLAFKIPLFLQITAFALLLGYLIAEKSGIPEK